MNLSEFGSGPLVNFSGFLACIIQFPCFHLFVASICIILVSKAGALSSSFFFFRFIGMGFACYCFSLGTIFVRFGAFCSLCLTSAMIVDIRECANFVLRFGDGWSIVCLDGTATKLR